MKQFESFFWGIIAALGAMVGQIFFFVLFSTFLDPAGKMSYGDFFSIPVFILVTAFIEEFFKYLMLTRRILGISSARNFLSNTFLMGIGFLAVEFFLISNSGGAFQLLPTAGIVVLHLATTLLLGLLIQTNGASKISLAPLPLLLASGFHASYNLAISQANVFFSYLAILALFVLILADLFLFSRSRKMLAQEYKTSYNEIVVKSC
jgi:hypothetical protein